MGIPRDERNIRIIPLAVNPFMLHALWLYTYVPNTPFAALRFFSAHWLHRSYA